ncbi:hypothetical protein V9T40_013208 [Parthenolecanium corni]|uniref:ABC transporter domain-containing protein n=1 Tax=Parthenolecanium corni TaxID=536013 RepID=A0AAN9TYN9_9HEMI
MNGFKLHASQLRAMLVRNITLKFREKRKLLWEVLLPLYSFVVLAFMKMAIPNPHYPSLAQPPYSSGIFDNFSLHLNYTVAVVPNTTEIMEFLDRVSEKWDAYRNDRGNEIVFVTFGSKDDLYEQYWCDPTSFSMAIIFEDDNPFAGQKLEYEIRSNPSFVAAPPSSTLFADLSACRENSYALAKALEKSKIVDDDKCPAYRYYTSGFVTLQMLLDFTKISIDTGTEVNLTNIDLRLFPKEEYTAADWMLVFRLVIPAYLVMSLSQFVTYLLMLIVKEKERKTEETLKIAGLRNSVFWLSWFLVYAAFVILLAVAATWSMFTLNVFRKSNFLLIFVLIVLYGFSIINFSFMLIPFLSHYRTAGVIGNFIVNTISLLYLIRLMVKRIDAKFLWLVSLLSPTAFTLAVDKALTMDVNGDELSLKNLWTGPGMSFGCSMVILCIDNFLYALLAYYFDQVIPGDYGAKRSPLFFLEFFFKIWKQMFSSDSKSATIGRPADEEIANENIEPVSESLKEKVGIEIVDLHKKFSTWFKKKETFALNGINLKIYEGQITAILGHNGAGKTTLFNILTGMTKPTSGTAFIFGHNVRHANELNVVRRMFGVCPQHNVLFDKLTAKEHLKLYSAIRGIKYSNQDGEVAQVLKDINLTQEAEVYSKYLSGGQKRKLTIACAVIGSPKILIFDEPTAGIDPYSRRNVWSVLQKYKAGKVILLTTHFMDEADLLADRKAVISNGQLRCVGTSLFLKNRFGIGYHLTFALENGDTSREIFRAVRRHIPQVELARHYGKELSLILPYSSVDKFATLFNQLESDMRHGGNRLGISSFGISMTTLEEIFLHLEKGEEFDHAEGSMGNRVLRQRLQNAESSSIRRRRISNSSSRLDPNENADGDHRISWDFELDADKMRPNYSDMLAQLLKLRFRNFIREPARCLSIFLVPLLFFTIGVHFVYKSNPDLKTKTVLLSRETYDNSTIIVHDSVGSGLLPLSNQSSTYSTNDLKSVIFDQRPSLGLIAIGQCCEELNISIFYNDTAVHSLPVIVNLLDAALYRRLLNTSDSSETATIVTKSYPFLPKAQSGLFDFTLISIAFGLGVQFIAITVIISTDYVYDRELKAKNLLRVNGLPFWMYYCSFFMVLAFTLTIIVGSHLFLIVVYDLTPFKQPAALSVLTLLFMLYIPCAILFATCLSYFFHSAETTQSVLLNSTSIVGLLPFGIVLLVDLMQIRSIYMFVLHSIFSIFDSFYLPFAIVYFVGRVYLSCLSNEACSYVSVRDYLTPEILIIAASCCLQIPTLTLIIQLLEYWRSFAKAKQQCNTPVSATNSIAERDNDDVKLENFRVTNFLSTSGPNSAEYPLIILRNLTKRYRERRTRKLFSKKTREQRYQVQEPKAAISNLTFAVGQGEIFGLLGHNGAGKTTTMKIITSEEYADGGQVRIKGLNITEEDYRRIFKYVGYCPQDDVLWKNITVREHIELYATIRGIPRDRMDEIIDAYLDGLHIRTHADKYSHQCSGGTKRKLSFALAMIGAPSIVLMDEPTNGMDPQSKRFLWDTILGSFQGSRGAILTTHAMEEVDALCSKVGILVNGKLRCIGSTQHLKNLYGAGYTLEIKIKSDDNPMLDKEHRVKEFVNDNFPMATLEETFSDHLVFRIPQLSVRSLGYCFTEIEKAKQSLQIEEYSFSQTTLEQVFMKLAHTEESDL